ncbi:MAG: polymorphic toxin-type HINT domain-containing protein, partial [[Eubacterium] siraeum]
MPVSLRYRIRDFEERDKIKIDGKIFDNHRNDIEDYALEKICREEITFDNFVEQYNALLKENDVPLETKLYYIDTNLGARRNKYSNSRKCLWKYGSKMRYYDIDINGEEIVTTDNHPFYVQGRGFIKAEGLFVGDKLISVDGKDLIVETHDIEQCEKPITVYNFKVEDYHTYFVGNCKIWVHNNDCVKKVESGEIELETKKQKGNYGEMKMDEHYDSKGFEKMHNGVESLDDKIHHGIDGVYKNKDPNGDPKFIIAEAKYGSSQLGNTKKSGPQMGDKWIKNNIGKIVDDPDDIIEG